MRTITSAMQALLDNDDGQEFVVGLEVFWGGDKTGPANFYATKEIAGSQVEARILDMDSVDEIIQVSQGGQSAGLGVTLDDSDGAIKTIFDENDIQKIPVRVWFFMLDPSVTFAVDRFTIFFGQINSPIEWVEGDRTISFQLVNRIEDTEVGFSAEEGDFGALPDELIGKTWPFCVGTTINVPALQAVPALSGTLAQGIGIRDFTLPDRIALAEKITCPSTPIGLKCVTRIVSASTYKADCNMVLETDVSCLQARCVEIERLKLRLAEEEAQESSSMTIFGGKRFPQGTVITLNIDGGLFTGSFAGTTSSPSELFTITSRQHPDFDPDTGEKVADMAEDVIKSKCPSAETDAQDSDVTQTAFGLVFTGARISRLSWEAYRRAQQASFFWARGGSAVLLNDSSDIIHIANIVPSTIKRVAAWRSLNGTPFLLTVPSEFFTVRQTNYGTQNIMEVVFSRPLSLEDRGSGGGWSDRIFISQVSSVDSNTVTIMEHLINTYTNYTTDTASFAAVKTKLANYPMDFALLRRPTILTILQEIAQRARCALWQKDDVFFIQYLAETPASVATIAQDDVLADDTTQRGTLRINLGKTEELVTKLTAEWVKDYAITEKNRVILRHNVKGRNGIKYGTHDRTDDYFPFAHVELVKKSATFWLARNANTFKKLKFSVSLEFMKLEPFDGLTINLPEVAPASFVATVERATFNAKTRQIDLEVWTPIRAGENAPYDFAHPAGISANAIFPTQEARNKGEAGSGNEPNFSTLAPPGHPLRADTSGLFRGVTLACNGAPVTSFITGECRQDHGDARPSDIDDVKPTTDIPQDSTGDVSSGTSPITNGLGDDYWSFIQEFKDWNEKTDGDAGRSRENTYINSDENDSFTKITTKDADRDFLDMLPDPDDLDKNKQPCQYLVTVFGFGIVLDPDFNLCFPQLPGRTELYVYDSAAAAEEFCDSLRSSSNCGSTPPCTQCISSCIVTFVGDPDECTTDGVGNLTAFRGSPLKPDTSFMDEATA